MAFMTTLTHIQRSSEAVLLGELSLYTAPPSPNDTFRRKKELSQQYIDIKESQRQPNRTDADQNRNGKTTDRLSAVLTHRCVHQSPTDVLPGESHLHMAQHPQSRYQKSIGS